MIEIWKQELGLDRLELIPPPQGSANQHYKGYRAGVADGHCCFAHPWLEGTAFENPSLEDVAQAARVIGKLHRRTMGANEGSLRLFSLQGELNLQMAKLPHNDPQIYPEVARRVERLQSSGFDLDALEREMPNCMLHGDYGWRNYHRLADGGLVLIDLEHAAYGPMWMEFGKNYDREFADPKVWDTFLTHYQDALGRSVPLPQPYVLASYLWQAAGIFNYCAARHHDEAFYQEGLRKLRLFDEMMS